MSKPAYIDIVRHVGLEGDFHLTIGPCPDSPGMVRLATTSPGARDWFGALDISMEANMARKLSKALIDCANEIDPTNGVTP